MSRRAIPLSPGEAKIYSGVDRKGSKVYSSFKCLLLYFGRGEGKTEINGGYLSKTIRVESESNEYGWGWRNDSLKEEIGAPYWIILIIFQLSGDFDILSPELFYG